MTSPLSLFMMIATLGMSSAISQASPTDSSAKISPWLQRERMLVRARTFVMATDNQPGLTDSYAWGVGVGLGYQTPRLAKHLQLGGSAFFSNNLLSSDLAARDPKTNQFNRYEIGLFNLQNPSSHAIISRLEELYARYFFGKQSKITLGRQLPRSPFINPQDGRLSPTFVEGVVLEWNELKNTSIRAEYVWRVAPRSTVGWHTVGESIGMYPVGVDAAGKASQYAGNTNSSAIIQLALTRKIGPAVVQVWDTHVQNLFNVAYVRSDWTWPVGKKKQLLVGLQLARQWAVGQGGNPDPARAYIPTGNRAFVMSGRVGYQIPKWAMFVNATRITGEGRFMMPREWGRDPYYTFLMREKNEGFGDLTAVSGNLYYMPTNRVKAEISTGYYHLPDVKNYALNKYGMPSYNQTNLSLTYKFLKSLKGLDCQVLLVHKAAIGNTYDNERYVFNKVGMSQLNVILNYQL